jgi:hypothetical protein
MRAGFRRTAAGGFVCGRGRGEISGWANFFGDEASKSSSARRGVCDGREVGNLGCVEGKQAK